MKLHLTDSELGHIVDAKKGPLHEEVTSAQALALSIQGKAHRPADSELGHIVVAKKVRCTREKRSGCTAPIKF